MRWMLLALLILWEIWSREVRWRDAWSFVLRAAPLSLLASLWWIVPAAVQSRYGIDFLESGLAVVEEFQLIGRES